MSATNKTAIYELPIFLGTDVPSWLTDWNGAMGIIDNAIAAAKAAADAAASTAGTAAADIVTIQGNITSLQGTVGTHTTQISTISGAINTINSLIGNGTPTTTNKTIIGAINELHADQGDLDDLTTTDKSSLVNAINEVAVGSESNEVVSDGTKTYSQFLNLLHAEIDGSKISSKTRLHETLANGTVTCFAIQVIGTTGSYRFTRSDCTDTGFSFKTYEVAASGSAAYGSTGAVGGTITGSNDSTATVASGLKMKIVY